MRSLIQRSVKQFNKSKPIIKIQIDIEIEEKTSIIDKAKKWAAREWSKAKIYHKIEVNGRV
jgi:hypothetical protein